jgi:hypothetical protein
VQVLSVALARSPKATVVLLDERGPVRMAVRQNIRLHLVIVRSPVCRTGRLGDVS